MKCCQTPCFHHENWMAIEMSKRIVALEAELAETHHDSKVRSDELLDVSRHRAELHAALTAERAKVARLVEALTPSGETKAEYIGEFSWNHYVDDGAGGEFPVKMVVPWTTIKEIMKAINARAAIDAARENT